ncbi:MAG: hypothetical protein Q7K16_00830 [Candidatus Azambacteria bacterium]|nr:hypothetical protein [Candidatus Azambacteria bacterium]
MGLLGDFDRGLVKMECDKKECNYKLPHYHCKICGKQVNNDELRRDYHPCCSLECIKIYNKDYPKRGETTHAIRTQ